MGTWVGAGCSNKRPANTLGEKADWEQRVEENELFLSPQLALQPGMGNGGRENSLLILTPKGLPARS